ncbi:hypothetical protein [Desulfobacter sp.]|uniref:hypothetical protein n=1 Tax=Desulfobacter sp. TaxID=2294 RepID=UPI000E9ADED7|nr:hypothetical protein [Desulfobacter sp.]HBT87896.1 hypothetical protein [Desulfobacter sp.]
MDTFATFLIAFASSISTVSIIGFVAYILRSWIIERLKASIKHEYDLKMLEVQRQKEIRLKSEIVAELLAQLIRKNGNLDYYELNKLSFQAFIWLPKDLSEKLSNFLSPKPGANDLRALIKDIRTYLQDEDDGFQPQDVIVFNEPDLHSTVNTSQVTSNAEVKPKPYK